MQFGFNKHEYIFQRQQNCSSPLSECSLLPSKNLQELIYTKLDEKSCCYLLIIHMKNALQKVKVDEILTAHARYLLQHAPVLQLYTFSANQEHAIFHR